MWLATPVILQLQALLSLLLGYVRLATVSTMLEANKFPRLQLIWALTQLRTRVHDSFVFLVVLMEAERVAVMDNVGV